MLTIDLRGRIALIVGGSRGIGAAVTETLAEAGAFVTFTHTGNPRGRDKIEALLTRVQDKGGKALGIALDACDLEGTVALAGDIVARHGKIDILVPNVGQNKARPIEDVSKDEWQHHLDINLTSAFNCVRAAVPHMVRAEYGRIIFIGSSALYSGGGGAIDYAAGKAGLTGMMMYLAKEYTRKGIVTNIVHPCLIDTDLLRERYSDDAAIAKLVSQVPVGRLGTPEDVAGIVAFLASPLGDYICAQSILADGGRTFFR